MGQPKNEFIRFLADNTPTAIDVAWQALQDKLNVYCQRRQSAELFKDEIYKWNLLSHYAEYKFDSVEKLKSWLSDKDNNLLSSRNFGSTYDGILKNERPNDSKTINAAFALFNSIDYYQKIKECPLFIWKNKDGKQLTISDRDIATYLFLQKPLEYMPYPSDVFARAAKDIGLNKMTMPRWMEFGKLVLLPMLAEKFGAMPVVDVNALKNLDIKRDFADIQAGKYLSMLDVQDFIYIMWRNFGVPDFHLWKLSHGSGFFSHEEHIAKLKANLIAMHPDTKAKGRSNQTQSEFFLDDKRQWDIVYVCRGNQEVSLLALIAPLSDFPIDVNGDDSWRARTIIPIIFAPEGTKYTGSDNAWWLPTNNSTFTEIKWKDKTKFEQEILQPCFHVSLEDLLQERESIMLNSTGDPQMNDLENLLLSAHQIILTGAPGTGKTYRAKQLAHALTGDNEKNHPHIEFCQFHPSLDYTDFVEGLRPISSPDNKEIGFERKDGIFKAFCKKAYWNNQTNFDESFRHFADFLAQNHSDTNPLELQTPNGAKYKVFLNGKGELSLITGQKSDVQGSLTAEKIKMFLTQNPYPYWEGYYRGVIKYLEKNYGLQSTSDKPEQKYVFIIDEINRGDISKIFGELFYAIDPGYRGVDGKITTQYANLLNETDIYKDGFFVPENVYIIGTMNDIDRSVESMDFAIRRRFTWVEIKADEATAMWDNIIPEHKENANAVMSRLNRAISQVQGLGDAFHIGPAYFLKLAKYNGSFERLWDLHIMPLLKEYLRGMPDIENALKSLHNAYLNQSPQETGE